MATIRKVRRRWQAIIRRKKVHISKTFWKKSDARFWADKTEAQIEVGSLFFFIFTFLAKSISF
tara:strand:+ start:266 stop:454 length:189 start_codon:yes stop_codon:yes gene_type:complete